jgi:hypothetical protein
MAGVATDRRTGHLLPPDPIGSAWLRVVNRRRNGDPGLAPLDGPGTRQGRQGFTAACGVRLVSEIAPGAKVWKRREVADRAGRTKVAFPP